jgi:hypothetical protein
LRSPILTSGSVQLHLNFGYAARRWSPRRYSAAGILYAIADHLLVNVEPM